MDPLNISAKFAVCIALPVFAIIAIAVLGRVWGCGRGKGGRIYIGIGDGTVRKGVRAKGRW